MTNFKVTVTYTDGSTTVTGSSMNKIAEPVYTKPESYPENVSSYIGCFGDGLDRNDPENTAMFYKLNETVPFATTYWIPVLEVKTETEKEVSSITFSGGDQYSGCSILGVTALKVLEKTNVDILDEYVEQINSGVATKADIDVAYQLLRETVISGELPAMILYHDIISAKAEYGAVTINDVEWKANTMTANINGSDSVEGQDYVLLVAVYDGNKLSEVKTVSNGKILLTNEGVEVSKTLENDVTGKKVKCFAIDSFEGMKPVSEVVIK